MKYIKAKKIYNTALLFVIVAPVTIIFYALYVFNPANAGNRFLYPLQLFADGITMFILSSLWLTLLLDLIQPEYNKREIAYNPHFLYQDLLTVDILVPVVNEDIRIVEQTILAIAKLTYFHKTYLLDDGNSQAMRALAQRYNINYLARLPHERKFAKSGNLNNALKHCTGEFFAIFDADHAPLAEFLTDLLPFFENSTVAMVQTPQHFINTRKFISAGSAQAQEIFYKFIQPAKNSFNSGFCVGTNMIFRRSAIDAIGGIATIEHSEDVWTSILLHEKGYETIFYNKVLAKGHTPDTVPSFFRQQNRWALGGFSLFFTHNPLFSKSLSIDQKLQYFFVAFFYFSTFALIIYIIFPLIYLLFGIHPMNLANGKQWVIHYIPYFVTLYFLPLILGGKFYLATVSTSMASFVPYLKAFFTIIFNKKQRWVPTGAREERLTIIMTKLWPHVLIIFLSFFSLVVGWYNPQNVSTTAITSIWVMFNAFVLFCFVKEGLLESL